VWPYVLDGDDALTGVSLAAGNVETLRAEFAAIVQERRRRERCRPVLVADLRALQNETSNQIAALNDIVSGQASQNAEQTNQIAEQSNQIAEQTNQIAEQSNQIIEQSNQIADLQRSTNMTVEQNQQMQEQNQQMQGQNQQMQDQSRQMHALLMSREQEPSADVDEDDERAVKRRRTGR
jgi:methyl-accepting chemotaxis protein